MNPSSVRLRVWHAGSSVPAQVLASRAAGAGEQPDGEREGCATGGEQVPGEAAETLGDIAGAASSNSQRSQRLELYIETVGDGEKWPPYVQGGVTLRVMRFVAGAAAGSEFAAPRYVSVGAAASCGDLASVLHGCMGVPAASQLWVGRDVCVSVCERGRDREGGR